MPFTSRGVLLSAGGALAAAGTFPLPVAMAQGAAPSWAGPRGGCAGEPNIARIDRSLIWS